jgi:spermidine dehydrogenase
MSSGLRWHRAIRGEKWDKTPMNKKSQTPLPNGITRRDFINGMLVGSGAALLPGGTALSQIAESFQRVPMQANWYGYGGVGDYKNSHGNTPEAVATAHQIRDGAFDKLDNITSSQEYDLVIVGCGMAGLGAALEFTKTAHRGKKCLILDNHPVFGGEAKENEFNVNGTTLIAPQGANGFSVPEAVEDPTSAKGDARYYAELNIPRELPYQDWSSELKPLKFCKDNYGYLVAGMDEASIGHFFDTGGNGQWSVDMWKNELEGTPFTDQQRRSLLNWYNAGNTRQFANQDEARRSLDGMSYKQFLEVELGIGSEAAKYADLFLASAAGLGSDSTSAFAAYNLPMPGFFERPVIKGSRNSFPGGNSGYARYFLKQLIPEAIAGKHEFNDIITGRLNFDAMDKEDQSIRIRTGATAVSVSHQGNADSAGKVDIFYHRDRDLHKVTAKAVVMATGGWINRHIVKDLPSEFSVAYSKFHHAPFLVANVALTNWRFMYELGITGAIWDKGEDDFGHTCNIRMPMLAGRHQPLLDPDKPAVLAFYTPFYYPGLSIEAQLIKGRAELFNSSYADYEQRIIRQMNKLFGPTGFVPDRDVAGLILNRWGHAYSVPYPGFYGGTDGEAPRDTIRRGYGRIAFAHSELDGLQHWGPAADEGRRAMNQLIDAI